MSPETVREEVSDLNALICVLPDAPSTEQQELFTQKLQQCCVVFDFLDSVTDLKSKEIKRATLNELVDYVSTNRGVLVESSYPEITDMVSTLADFKPSVGHLWCYGCVMLPLPPQQPPTVL